MDEIQPAVGSPVPLQPLKMDEPRRAAVPFKPIPPHFHSIIAKQLSAGVSTETSVQQLVAVGYAPEAARQAVEAVNASRDNSWTESPEKRADFTASRIVAIVFSGIWSLFGVLLYFQVQISSRGHIGPTTALVISGAITAFALLTGVFLALRKDAAAEACCLLPGILTIPLGIVLVFIVKLATKKRSVPL